MMERRGVGIGTESALAADICLPAAEHAEMCVAIMRAEDATRTTAIQPKLRVLSEALGSSGAPESAHRARRRWAEVSQLL